MKLWASCLILASEARLDGHDLMRQTSVGVQPKLASAPRDTSKPSRSTVVNFSQLTNTIAPGLECTSFARSGVTDNRIVGGVIAGKNEYPWQVRLHINGNGMCGGTIIHNEWVITAAHCCQGRNSIDVLVDDWDTNVQDPTEFSVTSESIHVHHLYPGINQISNDVCLIKVPDLSTKCTGCFKPACLPTKDIQPGEACFISGWGTTSSGGATSQFLKAAGVNVFSYAYCKANSDGRLGNNVEDGKEFCAGLPDSDGNNLADGGTDACQGDSGGPLTCVRNGQPVLAGLVSWGFGCADEGFPGVYANVYNYLPWIKKITNNIAPMVTPSATECPVGWTAAQIGDRDVCAKMVGHSTNGTSTNGQHNDMFDECVSHGGHLPIPTSLAESGDYATLMDTLNVGDWMWIGVDNPARDGNWVNGHTSAALTWTNWLANAVQTRRWGQINKQGKWGAYEDSEPLVCEIDQKSYACPRSLTITGTHASAGNYVRNVGSEVFTHQSGPFSLKKTGNGWTVLDANAVAISWDGNSANKCPVKGVMSGGAGGSISFGTAPAPATNTTTPIVPATNGCTFQDINIYCDENDMKLTVPKCAFTAANMDPSMMVIGQTVGPVGWSPPLGCKGVISTNEVVFNVRHNECQLQVSSNSTMTRYSASMTEVSKAVIHRGVNVATLGFHCEYNNVVNVTSDQRYTPLQGVTSIYSAKEDVTFNVKMNLFSDQALNNSLTTGTPVNIPDPIYTKLTVLGIRNSAMVVQVKTCWATPSQSAADPTSYTLIDNFLGVPAEVNTNNLAFLKQCAANTASWWFNSFAFPTVETVFIHCTVRICNPEHENCACNQAGRRRRRDAAGDAEGELVAGPVQVVQPMWPVRG